MPKAVRISIPIATKQADTQSGAKSESGELAVLALSSGVGLLISLILILRGVQAVWS